MSIQKAISKVVYGQTMNFNEAYHRIEALERNGDVVSIKVVSYTNDTKEHVLDVTHHQYTLTIEQENSIENAYDYIKTLPEFDGAIDV